MSELNKIVASLYDYNTRLSNDRRCEIGEYLESLPTPEPCASNWISVEERLPEQNKPRKAVSRQEYYNISVSSDVLVTDGVSVGIDYFYLEDWQGLETSPDGEITHWQPLPEPPES